MEKVYKEGKVGVIVSPGYGGGYSDSGDLDIFDKDVIHAIRKYPTDPHGAEADYKKIMKEKYNKDYFPDFKQLEVEWLPEGTVFQIHEYDGYESIQIRDKMSWHVA